MESDERGGVRRTGRAAGHGADGGLAEAPAATGKLTEAVTGAQGTPGPVERLHRDVSPQGAQRRRRGWGLTLAAAAAAGLVAMAVTAAADPLLELMVTDRARRRERRVRKGSAHDVAGRVFARRALGRRPTQREARGSQVAFTLGYGLLWGLVHGAARRRFPAASRAGGLGFAVPFFLLCDGVIAPLLRLTPGLHRLPWQVNAKELANHVVWTASAETVHRAVEGRAGARRADL